MGYFSVGLPWLTFSRPGETLKNQDSEGKNPQKSGSFLSSGRTGGEQSERVRTASASGERKSGNGTKRRACAVFIVGKKTGKAGEGTEKGQTSFYCP